VVVVLVGAQVLGQLVDAGGQNGNLNLGGTGVAFVGSVVQDDLGSRLPSRGQWNASSAFSRN